MSFKNEYIPPLEQETSEFLRKARIALNVGFSVHEMWTVDRSNDMVLVRTGAGSQRESANHEYWRFIDSRGTYAFTTGLVSKQAAGKTVLIERTIGFSQLAGLDDTPDGTTIERIKAALIVYKDSSMMSRYDICELVLKNANGEVL